MGYSATYGVRTRYLRTTFKSSLPQKAQDKFAIRPISPLCAEKQVSWVPRGPLQFNCHPWHSTLKARAVRERATTIVNGLSTILELSSCDDRKFYVWLSE